MGEKKCTCGRDYVYSALLQVAANKGLRDAGNCVIPDGWYCPVYHY